ncbi:MAG: urea ABC transporter ATP-binding protein UrtD [Planctomycetota bacterium]
MLPTDFALAVEDLTVSFDGFKALDKVSLYVDKGELRVVIGPNGAGKTTLLDIICGKTKPTSGSVQFMNHELTRMAEQKIVWQGVGRKFQTPSIYPKLNVRDNLEVSFPKGRSTFGALFFRHTQDVEDRIIEVAKEVFLDEHLDTEAELLSHGQKQWLEIGMLLMGEPELILLDEPVAGMSVNERKQTAELLRKVRENRSVVVIEHDMGFVRDIADKVTVMHQGKVLAEGPMDKIENDERVIEVYLGH